MLVRTQLLQHLTLLEASNFSAFKAYLKVNITTRQQALPKLLNQLLVFQPDFDITPADEKEIVRKLIPGVRYDKALKKLNRWCNDLLAYLENYLIKSYLDQEADQRRQLLRTVYLRQGAFDLYQKSLATQVKKVSEQRDFPGLEKLQYREKAAQLNAPQLDNLQHRLPSLAETIVHLEQQFAWERIRLELDELNQGSMFQQEEKPEKNFASVAWECLLKAMPNDHPTLKAYRLTKKALTATIYEHESFETARDFITDHINLLSHQDANILLRQLLNIGNRKLKAGALNFLDDVLALYQLGLHHQVFFQDGHLPIRLYINIATISDAAGAFEWAENFINTYQNDLAPSFQEPGFQLAMAGHLFQQGSTLQSLPLLQAAQQYLPNQHQLPVWYSLRRYSLDIRLHYEIYQLDHRDHDELEWAILRFSKYLQRKEIIHTSTVGLYANGIATIRMMLQYTLQPKPLAMDKSTTITPRLLRQQLDQALPWKKWLIAKIGELTQA